MKRWKRVLSGVLAVLIAVSLGACSQVTEKKKNGKEEEINASKGRYMETAVTIPEGGFTAIGMLEDGTLRVVTTTGIYDSKDKGSTWDPWEKMPLELKEDFTTAIEEEYGYEYDKINLAAVARNGNVFYGVKGSKIVYKMIAPDGSVRELKLEAVPEAEQASGMLFEGNGSSMLIEAMFAGNGDLVCSDGRIIYQIDTGSLTVKHKYEPIETFRFSVTGEKLFVMIEDQQVQEDGNVVVSDMEVTAYDLNTFKTEGKHEVLEEFLKSEEGGSRDLLKLIMSGADGKTLYFVNTTGVYRYRIEGTIIEKIFQGSMGKMSAPDSMVMNGLILDEENFILYYHYDQELVCYSFDPDAPSAPEKTLTIYSLYDNTNIRQIISSYQSKNPNVMVELEIGIKEGDAMTRTDALKTLNTNIMAGEGPDLLVLDGMPVDSYMEKGLLVDISSVIEETEKKDSLFENIVNTYQKDDAVLAVPTRFSVPVMFGKQEILSKADNLKELADVMEKLRSEQPGRNSVIGNLSPSLLLLMFMPASSPAWVKEDGTLDPDMVEQFVSNMKRIADAQNTPDSLAYPLEEGKILDLSPFMCSTEYVVTEMGYAGADMSLSHARANADIFAMESMLAHLGGTYKLMPGQSQHTFIPISPVGVSARGNETGLAKDFISFMLQDAQFIKGTGWPVNESAYDELKKRPENLKDGLRKMTSEDGSGSFELNYTWPKEQKFDDFKEIIGELTTPAVTDEMIIRTVFEEVSKCLNGEASVSDTTDTILKKVNLYLAE